MGHVGDIGRGGERRTGERPALRTGERPALRTGERPALRTGERPALADRGQSPRTSTRPALPAATFADALTQGHEGKVSTGAETLVMPKVELPPESSGMTRGVKTREMPALKEGKAPQDGKGEPSPDSSPEAREGRTVTTMDTPIGRGGGTRIVRMPETLGGKGRAEGEGPQNLRQGKGVEARPTGRDGFGSAPATGNRPALGTGQVKGPVLPVEQLIPGGLNELADLGSVAMRFASDAALLQEQVRPGELPATERGLRLWAFFTAYAEAAAGKESTPEAEEIFDKILKEQGFGEYRDGRTGTDGLKAAKWVLASADAEQARDRAGEVDFKPPPEVLLSESARKAESSQAAEAHRHSELSHASDAPALKDSAFTAGVEHAPLEHVPGQSEFVRVNPQLTPLIVPQDPGLRRSEDEDAPASSRFDELMKKLSVNKRLGGNMLWNLLHRSRNSPEDSAIEKEKWNQLVFAAILSFVGLMLLIILVVAL